ncbi:MAG TPA: CHAT domain-containing tetratricopeptide repeat protein [Streptosporangiaceae bacterium]
MIAQARAAHDTEALVVALRAQAWAQHVVLDNQGAKKTLDLAARLARREGLGHRLGDVLVTRAVALHELGRRAAARRDLDRAELLVRDERRPEIGLQQALLEHNAGRNRDAAALYQRVLADPLCPPDVWIKAANNLSVAYTELGRPQAALDLLEQAAARAREQSPLLVAIVTNSQAWSSFHAGEVVASLRLFEQAAGLYVAAGMPLGEHYLDYADVLVDLRLLDEALTVARSAADEFESHGARLMAAQARLRCAQLALLLGDREVAGTDAGAALAEFRRQRRTAWTARATVVAVEVAAAGSERQPDEVYRLGRAAGMLQRHGLRPEAVGAHLAAGRAALAAAETRTARQHFRSAGELARGQALLVRLRGRLAQALDASTSPQPGPVLRHCRTGLTDLARHRAALPSMELRMLASGHGAELGELGLRELRRGAPAARVFTWMELTRAASLLSVEPPVAAVQEDLNALRVLDQELRTARREADQAPAELLARRARLETRIRRAAWTGPQSRSAQAELAGSGELRSLLGGRYLAEYATAGDQLVAVVIGPHGTRLVELGPAQPVYQATDLLLFSLRRLLRRGHNAQARESAEFYRAALRRALVTPLGVGDGDPLVIVPSGRLHRVPWPGLHPAETCVVPSATFWARSRRAARPANAGRLALVAGPDLPGALAEVQEIHRTRREAGLLLPPDSSVQATLKLISGVDLAHLACHGLFRSDNPLFSSLLLSDGPLTLYEVLNAGGVPRRVVLAACDVGAEYRYAGGEVLGFVSALMARGTAGVVTSAIPLPDGASVPLMTSLHRKVTAGASMAQALWEARTTADLERAEDYVAWSGVTAYGAA